MCAVKNQLNTETSKSCFNSGVILITGKRRVKIVFFIILFFLFQMRYLNDVCKV